LPGAPTGNPGVSRPRVRSFIRIAFCFDIHFYSEIVGMGAKFLFRSLIIVRSIRSSFLRTTTLDAGGYGLHGDIDCW